MRLLLQAQPGRRPHQEFARPFGTRIFDGTESGGASFSREKNLHEVLLQHGLFTWGATAKEAYDHHIELVTRAEQYLGARQHQRAKQATTDAVLREWEHRRARFGDAPPSTLFFGGGTPSLTPPGEIARMIRGIAPAPGAEISLEANPHDLDAATLDGHFFALGWA